MQMIRNTEILLIITIHQTSQSSRKSVRNVHCKDWCWGWSSNTLATWCKELTNLKKHWYWERLKAGGEGNDRGWDAWMASPTPWTWVWASSESWWWTGRPGVLQSMGSQRPGLDWATELNREIWVLWFATSVPVQSETEYNRKQVCIAGSKVNITLITFAFDLQCKIYYLLWGLSKSSLKNTSLV